MSDEPEPLPHASPVEDVRTIFQPLPQSPPPVDQSPPPPEPPPAPMAASTGFMPGALASEPRNVRVGDVLNHIFEVKRFIARGGMGEVFEGANVNSDERVAIKVMLPNLAADPNVQAMFRKEARTLTRLNHAALVQYRVLAQEPQLGVFYIVTEYVDGRNLSDVLRTIETTPQSLLALTRRLADGLRNAHSLGAIHRDISPDNVMLEDGRLEGAKIIDFGIAKDLDPGSATIIGDGFAGKLAYVAPEQLGDFGRDVGPWSDVYSLGLVILAIAQRRDVDMGGSLVDAVDKRRAGPDLSALPDLVRPVIAEMLRPNPADRLRSMDAVIDLIDGKGIAAVAVSAKKPGKKDTLKPAAKPVREKTPEDAAKQRKLLLVGGGGAGVLALVAVVGVLVFGGDTPSEAPIAAPPEVAIGSVRAPVGDPVVMAKGVMARGLAGVTCTWLDVTQVIAGPGGVTVALAGAAGRPADAQGQLSALLQARGINVADIDFKDVSPIEASECPGLDAFRQIRATGTAHMTVPQRVFEIHNQTDGEYKGSKAADVVLNFDLGPPSTEAALFGIQPNGNITTSAKDRSEFETLEKPNPANPNQYRARLQVSHTGMSGIMLLTGRKPFDPQLIAGPAGSRAGDWSTRFLSRASVQGWKSEMVWFKTVDANPD